VTLVTAEPQPPLGLTSRPTCTGCLPPVCRVRSEGFLGFASIARRVIEQSRFDVIFSLERTLRQDALSGRGRLPPEWLARRRAYRLLPRAPASGPQPLSSSTSELRKKTVQDPKLRLVIANSRQVQAEVQRHYQVAPDKIQVIYNGVDRQRFSRNGWRSFLQGRSGTWDLIQAYHRFYLSVPGLNAKDCTFYCRPSRGCSDGEPAARGRSWPHRTISKSGPKTRVAHRVKFLGPQVNVERFYAGSQVVALPTIYDPCSNVVLEALAGGRRGDHHGR